MKIVWLQDPTRLGYVRTVDVFRSTKAGRIANVSGINKANLIGYEVLPKEVKPGYGCYNFVRKVLYVCDHDRCFKPNGIYANSMPHEGIPVEKLLKENPYKTKQVINFTKEEKDLLDLVRKTIKQEENGDNAISDNLYPTQIYLALKLLVKVTK